MAVSVQRPIAEAVVSDAIVGMKRKAAVRCAAANDDEDLGGLFDSGDLDRKARKAASDELEKSSGASRRKEKAFAWMDSEDEEEGADKDDDGDEQKDDLEDEDVSVQKLDMVQSFGRMMLLAPALQKKLKDGSMGPEDATATCRALARTKFFDGDLLEDLSALVRKLLRSDRLSASQTGDAILCLKALNYHDKSLFSTVASVFKPRAAELEASIRLAWLEAFRGFNHATERDFQQMLEVPPVATTSPSYRKVRCSHHARGRCELGSSCTFSHDMRAPLSLADEARQDTWRTKTVMLTQDQKTLGNGAYGRGPLGRDTM